MRLWLLILLVFSGAALAEVDGDSAFPVEHIEYIDSGFVADRVEFSRGRVVLVFSDGSCLWTSFPARSCFLFERKLDTFGPQLKARKVTLLGIDIGFRNLDILERYPITKRPTALVFQDGREVERFEPFYEEEERVPYRLSWQDELAKRVTDYLFRY